MANVRVIYPSQQIVFAKDSQSNFIEAHGVQSTGITINFNLEQIFEMSKFSIYQNIDQLPEVEVTIDKVLDGYPLLFHLATNGATSGTLLGRSKVTTDVGVTIFSDVLEAASGIGIGEIEMPEMAISSVSYSIQTQGSATESVGLVGGKKVLRNTEASTGLARFTGRFTPEDAPLAPMGVQQRQHVVMVPPTGAAAGDVNGVTTAKVSTWPREIPGITVSGPNPLVSGKYVAPIQSVTVSADLGREQIFELGLKVPYAQLATFPVEVRTEIEVLSTKWDNIAFDENSSNSDQTIEILLEDSTYIQTGTKNRLATCSTTGGDAGGGGSNVLHRYSYVTYSDLVVQHDEDPSGL